MNTEIDKLKQDIEILERRVNELEKIERRRKSLKIIGIIIKLVIYLGIIIAIWIGYNYVVSNINNIPNLLNNKIAELNPFNKSNK